MSNLVLTAVLLLVGIALTVGGVFFYRTGLKLFGFLLGGGGGFFAASTMSLGPIPTIAVILLLGFVGLAIANKIYLIMLVVPGAVTGFGAALAYTGTSMDPLTNLLDPVILAGPVIGAVLAVLLQKVVVVFVSAAWGAVLIWAGLDASAIVAPLAALSVPTPPTWIAAVIAGGVAVQIVTWALLRHYDDDELKAKVSGLFGRGSGGGQPEGGI
ncbi:hypothetical protein [Halorientalis halophila]|uniref:hypothetical protein n=1 Tax=Halorientalis halophila TaxID=3108499 RepID=UPI00300974FD